MPRKPDEESEDLDSNAPLLPQPASGSHKSPPPAPSTSSTRERFALQWWHPILGAATVVLLWTAISVSGIASDAKPSKGEDAKWPTFPEYRGPTPTVRSSLVQLQTNDRE